MARTKIPRWGTNGFVEMESAATIGATIGRDLFWPDGSQVTEAQLRAAATPPTQTDFPVTYWRLVEEIPPNVVALAQTGTTGLYVITGDGASATRALEVELDQLTVDRADGVDGNPLLGLAEVPDSGVGALLAIERDEFGRVTGTRDATITGTFGEIDVADGDAVAGLPTISLADVDDEGGGTLQRTVFDEKGRRTGTSAATTDDLAEGEANRYFTDERARAAAVADAIDPDVTDVAPSQRAVAEAIESIELTPGPPGKDGQIRFTGTGPPPVVIVGASPGDTYLDIVSGDVFKLT